MKVIIPEDKPGGKLTKVTYCGIIRKSKAMKRTSTSAKTVSECGNSVSRTRNADRKSSRSRKLKTE